MGTDCKERYRAVVVAEVQDFVEGAHAVIGRSAGPNSYEVLD